MVSNVSRSIPVVSILSALILVLGDGLLGYVDPNLELNPEFVSAVMPLFMGTASAGVIRSVILRALTSKETIVRQKMQAGVVAKS